MQMETKSTVFMASAEFIAPSVSTFWEAQHPSQLVFIDLVGHHIVEVIALEKAYVEPLVLEVGGVKNCPILHVRLKTMCSAKKRLTPKH